MTNTEPPKWLDDIDIGTIAVLTLDDGECLTADILNLNDEGDRLIVNVVSSNRPSASNDKRSRSISVSRVVSVESRSRGEQPWPYSDPCRCPAFSVARFVLMATLFLSLIFGSLPLFLLLMKRPFGVQEASVVVYTLFVVFFTFGSTGTRTGKNIPPYRFTCPAVKIQVSRLLLRHLGFLVALLALQTFALEVSPNLPDWWNTGRKGTPFQLGLVSLCFGLGFAQVLTNRRILDRSHREFPSKAVMTNSLNSR
jgi:hypothetical protein